MLLRLLVTLRIILVIAESANARSIEQEGHYQVEGCPKCEKEFCPKSGEECRHGLVHDHCGCCPGGICELAELEKCFNIDQGFRLPDSGLKRYGTCGDKMECISRTDARESQCVCRTKQEVCGSDNTTYSSICQMPNHQVHFQHYGPCVSRPVIVSRPEAELAYEGGAFAMDCEAKGFPVPTINWEFRSHAGKMLTLPGDDTTIVVHSRGGPEKYMITSWLQIEYLRRDDSGTYICIASNSQGEDRAMNSIQVTHYS